MDPLTLASFLMSQRLPRQNPGIPLPVPMDQQRDVSAVTTPDIQFPEIKIPDIPPDIDTNAELARLYQPSNKAGEAYLGMMGKYPTREQYKAPSMLKRIGMNMIGQDADLPYNEARRSWLEQEKVLSEAARIEDIGNKNDMYNAQQTVAKALAMRKQEQDAALKTRDQSLRNMSIKVRDYMAKNAGTKLEADKTGEVWLIHPDGRKQDLGFKSHEMPEDAKLEYLRGTAESVARIGQGGATSRTFKMVKLDNGNWAFATPDGKITDTGMKAAPNTSLLIDDEGNATVVNKSEVGPVEGGKGKSSPTVRRAEIDKAQSDAAIKVVGQNPKFKEWVYYPTAADIKKGIKLPYVKEGAPDEFWNLIKKETQKGISVRPSSGAGATGNKTKSGFTYSIGGNK